MSIYLALDIGKKRVGIATGDFLGISTKALKTCEFTELKDFLRNFLKNNQVLKIIVGLPKHKDGNESELSKEIKAIVEELKLEFHEYSFIFEDEVLSSKEAISRLTARGIKIAKNNKALIDAEAASIILEQYFINNL